MSINNFYPMSNKNYLAISIEKVFSQLASTKYLANEYLNSICASSSILRAYSIYALLSALCRDVFCPRYELKNYTPAAICLTIL